MGTFSTTRTKTLVAIKNGLNDSYHFDTGGSNMSDEDDHDERDFDYSDSHPDETVDEFEDHEDHDYD